MTAVNPSLAEGTVDFAIITPAVATRPPRRRWRRLPFPKEPVARPMTAR